MAKTIIQSNCIHLFSTFFLNRRRLMEINDIKGMYTLKIDLIRNVVYETPRNYWKHEDYLRLHNEYVTKVVPLFNGKPWRKCCDLRTYHISMITEDIQDHVKWGSKNGFIGGVIIIDSSNPATSAIALQMKLGTKHIDFDTMVCESLEEANLWLESRLP